jgi:putative membrane protein insertion efficiency factor
MIKKLLLSGIKAYQRLSRAVFFNNCRFYPTCSQYDAEAIERYGVIIGVKKAIGRILRCSPFSDGGHDPVR